MAVNEALGRDGKGTGRVMCIRVPEVCSRLIVDAEPIDRAYHNDQFFRDRLLTAVEIPSIQQSLRDRLPRSSQIAINRIANQFSDHEKTSGTAAYCCSMCRALRCVIVAREDTQKRSQTKHGPTLQTGWIKR